MDGLDGIALWDIDSPVLYDGRARRTATIRGDAKVRLPHGRVHHRGLPAQRPAAEAAWAQPPPVLSLFRLCASAGRRRNATPRSSSTSFTSTSSAPRTIRNRTWFLDACDRLGLLVFEEIPGWQHIGGEAWKAESVENVRRMITPRLEPSLDHPLGRADQRIAGQTTTSMPRPTPRPRARSDPPDRRRPLHHRQRDARGRLHDERLHPRQ